MDLERSNQSQLEIERHNILSREDRMKDQLKEKYDQMLKE